MIEIPRVHDKRLEQYYLTVTEPLREGSLEQIQAFCDWFDKFVYLANNRDESEKVVGIAKELISALASYNQQLAAIVLNRNKWVGENSLPEADKNLVELLCAMANKLGYSEDKLIDFTDALIRLIAESNHNNVHGLTEYLDSPLAWHISGDR